MANEISLTASLTVLKALSMAGPEALSVVGAQFTMTGNTLVRGPISVPTTGVAVPLGQVTSPHWSVFVNLDTTNYLTLQNGVSGAVFARLLAGEYAFLPLDPACVPYAIANTAAVLMDYLIVSL